MVNAPAKSDEERYKVFLKKGSREELAVIFRKYMTLVFGVCMKYIGEKHAAQDATMEVFEKLLSHHPKAEVQNFRAYLFVVSRNHCLMKKRGDKPVLIEISQADMELTMEVHPIDKDEQEAALNKCLAELKDLQKTCVELFYLSKKSYTEISSELKVTLNAVKSHIQNGKRNLKLCIEANE
ncbi:MAG: sigma-70 family RNA polymerase sigma factor [Flavobacteriales bacterium]